MEDLVSIIMPSYNTGRFIRESIESVLGQTCQNWELLIVDDGSTDDTLQVIKGVSDPRIRLFCNEKNSGAAVSRNRALREAKGRWIAFLDSDDLWHPEKLERQIRFMKETGCHFSYTAYQEMEEQTGEISGRVSGPKKIGQAGIYCYCWPGCLTVMYDREYVGLVQIEDLRRHNDYAMWLQVTKTCDCYLFDEIMATYRRRRISSKTSDYINQIRRLYLLWRKGEGCSTLVALLLTGCNLVFGLWKKLYYVRK